MTDKFLFNAYGSYSQLDHELLWVRDHVCIYNKSSWCFAWCRHSINICWLIYWSTDGKLVMHSNKPFQGLWCPWCKRESQHISLWWYRIMVPSEYGPISYKLPHTKMVMNNKMHKSQIIGLNKLKYIQGYFYNNITHSRLPSEGKSTVEL